MSSSFNQLSNCDNSTWENSCENCGETFTSPKIIWNAVRNWVKKNGYDSSSIFQNVDNSVPVSLNRIDNFSQRFTYDMEYYTRNPCEEMERILQTFILFQYNEHDYHHRKGDIGNSLPFSVW